jgi:hypothetical protein
LPAHTFDVSNQRVGQDRRKIINARRVHQSSQISVNRKTNRDFSQIPFWRGREAHEPFDVDGAYNARYEIVKKRIDKATVRNGAERLTQPGRIAIVYGHSAEAAEYCDYIEYLQSLGYLIAGDVEEARPGRATGGGLRALRVGIDLTNPRLERPVNAGDLSEK